MAFEVRLLGSVEALADGRSLSLGGSKQRSVVAMLALRANRTVSADDLIDGLWGDDPPPSAAKNVQLYVSRLRRALGANDSVARIVTHGRGYELQLPEDAVDAARFERLVERAQRQAEQGIVNGAAQGALELWRGAPLADVASEPFAAPEIRRLEELRLRAIELMIDAELAAGRHGEVIGTLEALLVDHPLNERFHAQRMLALYRSGRQADALEAYREATRTLIDQIGVRPGPELGRLEQAILDQDPSLEPSAPQEELPPQLEGGSPLLAGRERECRWLRKRWEEAETHRCRLALISGPAGIGKTRLAAEVATELQRTGVAVLYASGAGAPESALETVQSVAKNERPTLLVLDDADDASPALLHAPTDLVAEARESPLLVLALCRDDQGPSALTALETAGAAQRLRLRPLRAEAIAEIATLYERTDTMAMPLETLMAESEGVALRIHRAASAWAQERTAERLEATVSSAATGRGGLRAVEAQLAGTVADLQATREHARLYLAEDPDPTAPDVCPFRGLAPFHSAHAEYFFGRERLVADLVARIVGSALLAVVGPSGSGKSSLVRAGLLPALASGVLPGSERWRQAVMRPGPQPVEELRRALARLAPGDRQIDPDDPFTAVLGSLGPDERLVLAVDQLEEIFAACRDEGERRAFAEQLVTAAVYPDHRLVVVLAIRGDFYDRCAEYPALASEMSANTVLVGPMRREELRRAIELPARAAGLRVEPRLVSALVGEVADEPGGLPLLSTTLLELWEQRDGRTLGYSTYEASGGVSGAVARLAERAYQRLSAPQRERARQILMRLVDAEEMEPVARRVPLSELELERDEDAAAALSVLTESRLVTVDEGTVEVAHEALLREWPRLRGWLEDDAQGWRLRQHLTHAAGEWQGSGREPAELYRGARLASALGWAETHDPELNELEREFLEESRAGSEREAERQRRTNRRLRSLLVGVGVLLTLAVIAGVIARSERQSARSAATAEAAQRLGAQALTEERVDRAALLATAGVVLDDSLATRSSLLSTLVRNPAVLGFLGGDGDPLNALALSPDGRTLAIGDEDGTVTFYDTETRAPMNTFQTHGFVTGLAFDPRGRSVAITSKDEARGGVAEFSASLHIIDADTLDARRSTRLGYQPVTDPRASQDYFPIVTYAAGGRSVVVGYVDISGFDQPLFLRRFDARGGEALGGAIPVGPSGFWGDLLVAPDGRLFYTTNNATYAIDAKTFDLVRRYPVGGLSSGISADGTTLAIGSKDGRVRLLDLASGRVQTLNGRHEAGVQDEAFTPDGRMLATSDEDATVIVWDLRTGRITERLTGHRSEDTFLRGIPELTFSPDGRTLYSASFDSTAIIWDVAGDRRLGRPFTAGDRVRIQDRWPPAFSISPDGRTLAVASLNGRVNRIDAETLQSTGSFEALPAFESHKTPAAAIEYTPDGRRLAVGGGRGLVGLWNASSGQRAGPLLHAPPRGGFCAGKPTFGSICFEAVVQAVAVGTGGLVAAASLRGVVRIWDLDSRELIRPPLHLQRIVSGLAFSPDGSQLAIPTGLLEGDPAVEIRDPRSGERIARLVPQNEVRTVAFSPDGRLLAAGQVDGSTTLWTTDGWTQVGQPLVRPERVLGVAFSPDGRTLATSHGDGTVVLWDLESRQPIGAPLPGPAGDWVTARFTPDGSHLFAVYESGTAIRWEVDPAVWRQHACAVADGGLTREEWEEVVPEQDYLEVCPG